MFGCLLHYVSLCHTASPYISNFPRTVWMKTQDSLPVSIWNSNTLSIQDLLDLTRVEVGQGLHLTSASSLIYPYFSEATIRNSFLRSSVAPPWLRPLCSQVSASILSNNQIMYPKLLHSPLSRGILMRLNLITFLSPTTPRTQMIFLKCLLSEHFI